METQFGSDYHLGVSRRIHDSLQLQIESHLNRMAEKRAQQLAERARNQHNLTHAFSTELAKVVDRPRLAEFRKLCGEFLLEHPGLDADASKITEHNTKLKQLLKREQ